MVDDTDPRRAPPGQPGDEANASQDLLDRAQRGDREALDQLLARFLPGLRRWASGRLPRWARDMSETADFVQNALLQTFSRVERFEPRDPGALKAYLRQAVLNQVRDEYRRSRRRPATGALDSQVPDPAPAPLERAMAGELSDAYQAALDRLKPEERDLVVGRMEMGLSYEELADVTGRPNANAARSALVRVLVKMAEEMRHVRE